MGARLLNRPFYGDFAIGRYLLSLLGKMDKVELKEEPYVALFLKEVNRIPIDRQKLRLPLVAACSMSTHIRLILPVSRPASLVVDGVFDELFKRYSQIHHQVFKDFIARSKGILYANGITTLEEQYILRYATFLMTTDVIIWRTALDMRLPNALIIQCENKEPKIIISHCEEIEDRRLRHCIAIAFEYMHIEKNDILSANMKAHVS